MSKSKLVESFKSCLRAGDTRPAAWELVAIELSDMIGEYLWEGLDTSELSALQEWWSNQDYRNIA